MAGDEPGSDGRRVRYLAAVSRLLMGIPCAGPFHGGQFLTETHFGEASSERMDGDGEPSGVAVRQVTSPTAPFEGLPDHGPRKRPRALIAGVVLVAVLAIPAAIVVSRSLDGEPASAPGPAPTLSIVPPVPTTVDAQQVLESAVIRDYLAGWAAYNEATGLPDGKPVNPDLIALSQYMVGDQLKRVKSFIIGMKADGLTALGQPAEFHPTVVSVQETTAIVRDCYTSTNHIVDAKTHALRDAPGTATVGVESTLQLDAVTGVWKTASAVRKPELCAATS